MHVKLWVALTSKEASALNRIVMAEKPKSGLRNVILVWVIGLTLGVGAGAATALLLMPSAKSELPSGASLADKLKIGG
jgi:hypothetical protein